MVIISGLVGPKPRRIAEVMDIRLIFLNRRSLYTVHGEIFGADSWYVSVQPRGNPMGVKVSLRTDDSGEGTG